MLTRLGGNLFFPIIPIIIMGKSYMLDYYIAYAVIESTYTNDAPFERLAVRMRESHKGAMHSV